MTIHVSIEMGDAIAPSDREAKKKYPIDLTDAPPNE
jgi:hypothetical protein